MADLSFIPLCSTDGPIAIPKVVSRGPVVQESYPVTATVKGKRLSGTLQGIGFYDWMSGPAGIGKLRVVASLDTDDGAVIHVEYEARADITTGVENARGFASPVFAATDLNYLWLNDTQVVGRGIISGDRIHWEWYEVVEGG